jgi:inosine-uridine nucleoside N-ribohydrolase
MVNFEVKIKRMVIDCDPGINDAATIVMAYMHPETVIEAITKVYRNVNVTQTTANALKVLDILAAESIPLFSGASSPLFGSINIASFVHDVDGLGDLDE